MSSKDRFLIFAMISSAAWFAETNNDLVRLFALFSMTTAGIIFWCNEKTN